MDELLVGLRPLVYDNSRVLILGSMPGKCSLENARYYDHGANRFWKIMFELFGKQYTEDYEQKKQMLKEGRIALWDAIKSCRRPSSSLDSKIRDVTPNDITGLLEKYPSIKYVVTGGRTSEKYLTKYNPTVEHIYLPSTSPANAGVKNVEEIWLSALRKMLNE